MQRDLYLQVRGVPTELVQFYMVKIRKFGVCNIQNGNAYFFPAVLMYLPM